MKDDKKKVNNKFKIVANNSQEIIKKNCIINKQKYSQHNV